MQRGLRRRTAAAVVVASLLVAVQSLPTAAASRPAPHRFRVVAVLATIPALSSVNRSSVTERLLARAVRACDLAQVTAGVASGARILTTPAGDVSPIECAVLPVRNGESRLLLAPLAGATTLGTLGGLSGQDVRSARLSFSPGSGHAVDLKLTSSGTAKFNALAAASFGRPSPRDEVAIVIDGLVYAAPSFQSPSFNGSPQVTGNFTAAQAKSLAAAINASRRDG